MVIQGDVNSRQDQKIFQSIDVAQNLDLLNSTQFDDRKFSHQQNLKTVFSQDDNYANTEQRYLPHCIENAASLASQSQSLNLKMVSQNDAKSYQLQHSLNRPNSSGSQNFQSDQDANQLETYSNNKEMLDYSEIHAVPLVGQLGGIEEVDSQDFDEDDNEECDDEGLELSDEDDFNNRLNDNENMDDQEAENISGQGSDNEDLGGMESDIDKENDDDQMNTDKVSIKISSKADKTKNNDSKKDKKNKKKSTNQVGNSAATFLNPQIKITISSKKGDVKKQTVNQKNSNFLNTPNQNNKGKANKLANVLIIMLAINKLDCNSNSKPNSNQNSQQKKKKNNRNIALIHSLPRNLEEESIKFFESNCTYNPVFEYENANLAQNLYLVYLSEFKQPNDDLMLIAKKILDAFLSHYESESSYLLTEGQILTLEETEKYFMDYLEALGITDQVTLSFQKNKIAPTSVTHDPKTGKSKINIGLPIEYREGRIMGVLHHEIGTHFLRKYNEKMQVWYKKREKYELRSCIQTEEGFATINQYFEMSQEQWKKPFLYKAALNYYSAYMASKMSFVELFNDLEKYIDNPRRRWKCTLRVKRGMVCTQEPGGLYKDQVYLEGVIYNQISKERHSIDFVSLYCGKISLEDLKKPLIEKRLKKEGILLPTFMSNMSDYMKALDVIAKTNFID